MNVRDRIRALRGHTSRISDRYVRDAIKTTVEALTAIEHWLLENEKRIEALESREPSNGDEP